MLGLAQALDRIINYDGTTTAQSGSFRTFQKYGHAQILAYHCDLRPAKILVYVDENGCVTLKISGFGQAKVTHDSGELRTYIGTGTDTYMAPEATVLNGQIHTRYDVWSLGCIFVEMVNFLRRSSQGISESKQKRKYNARYGHDFRYFNRPAHGSSPVLRRAGGAWIDQILPDEEDGTPAINRERSAPEIRKFLLRMLQPMSAYSLTIF